MILGSGGSARTVSSIFRKLGIEYRHVSRNKEHNVYVYEKLNEEIMQHYQIMMNTNTTRHVPEVNACPNLPFDFITKEHLVYDLIYNPEESLLLKKAKQQKAQTKNGLDMLYLQAEKAFDIFLEPWKGK